MMPLWPPPHPPFASTCTHLCHWCGFASFITPWSVSLLQREAPQHDNIDSSMFTSSSPNMTALDSTGEAWLVQAQPSASIGCSPMIQSPVSHEQKSAGRWTDKSMMFSIQTTNEAYVFISGITFRIKITRRYCLLKLHLCQLFEIVCPLPFRK